MYVSSLVSQSLDSEHVVKCFNQFRKIIGDAIIYPDRDYYNNTVAFKDMHFKYNRKFTTMMVTIAYFQKTSYLSRYCLLVFAS